MLFNDQFIDLPTLDHVIDRSPLTISPETYLSEAIALMNQERSINYTVANLSSSNNSRIITQESTDYVLIIESAQVLGIFTEKDVVKVAASGIDLWKVKIAEVMQQQIVTLRQSDYHNIFTTLLLLRQHQIRHLPILDNNGQLLGIVTETNLLRSLDLLKITGVVEGLHQSLQKSPNELEQSHEQIEEIICQTQDQVKKLVEEKSAEVLQVNQELQNILEELQVAQEELRQQNESLILAHEIAELEHQRYQDLFEFAPQGYLITNALGIIKESNQAATALLGVQPKYLVGKPLVLFIAEQDRRNFLNYLTNLQQIQEWELYLQPRQGKPFLANIRVAAMFNSKGEKVGWRCLLNDISDRKQQEEALRQATNELEARVAERTAELVISNLLLQQEITERQCAEEALGQSENLYRHLVESQTDMVIRVDLQGRVTFANPAACQTFGWQVNEFFGQSFFQIFHPHDLLKVMENMRTLTSLPYGFTTGEQRTFTVNGIRWIEWNITAIKNDQGQVVEAQGVGRDMTQRKQMEEALRESEEKFRHFAENTHALIWIADSNSGDNIYVNPAYEKIWGRSCQSIRNQPNSWLEGIHPEDRELVRAKLEQQLRGEPSNTEYRILHPDGSVHWVWDRGFAMQDEQGKIYYYAGVAEDITERKQAEKSLQESEARLSLALEAAQMGIWDWNLITNNAVWSANMGLLYGLPNNTPCPSYEYLLNLLVHPEDGNCLFDVITSSIEQGIELSQEYRVVWPNGEIHWLCLKGQVYHNQLGQPMRMIATVRDITDRKQAEAALRESEQRYRSVVTAMQEGIVLQEASNGKITACNTSAERILGLSANEIIGRSFDDPCWQAIHEDGSAFLREDHPIGVTLRTGKPCSHVIIGIYKPDEQLIWISINSQPLFRDNESTAYGVVASFSDITEQQAALRDRQQAQEKIQQQAALLDIATDAILVRDFQNQIVFWNKSAERLYGWQVSEALFKNPEELLFKESTPQLQAAFKNVLKFGKWQGELNKVTKSGKEIIVSSRWTLVRDPQGEPQSILCVDTDITEKKQLQAQFFRAQRLESLGTLAGGIAHDLNNILTPILASAQLLQGRFIKDQERTAQLLEIVENNSKRGAALVKQVLSFARGLKGEQTIVQFKHLIAEITQIIQQTFPKSIEFSTVISEDLAAVCGDVTQLHQVLMNLVVNARDAMPNGGVITISAENKFLDQAYAQMNLEAVVGHYIVITVADTGMGMSPEILERIFEPFYTTKDIGIGTGLGLSTVLGIMKTHSGFVRVSSKVNQGSQFQLFLPAVETIQILSADDVDMPQGEGELILVVDDEAQIREIATIILENHNYKTLTASNGIEAIALYAQQKHRINAVVMDMMMPEMDGITAMRTLRKMNPQVQIIAVSGLNSTEFFTQATDLDVQAFLSKPFTARDLLKSLHQLLRVIPN